MSNTFSIQLDGNIFVSYILEFIFVLLISKITLYSDSTGWYDIQPKGDIKNVQTQTQQDKRNCLGLRSEFLSDHVQNWI